MSFKERENAILEYLMEHKEATVSELAHTLFVSEPTMRRDLYALSRAGKLLRTHGGAAYKGARGENLPQAFREREQTNAKAIIARRALSLIEDGATVMVDASSTAAELLKLIGTRHGIAVVTNNAGAPVLLSETAVKTYVSGGELAQNTYAFVGGYAEDFMRAFHADICFFSVRRLSSDGALTDNAIAENAIRRVMLSRAKKKVLLLDSKKIGEPCLNTLCSLADIDYVIAEEDISRLFPAYKDKFLPF